MEKAPLDLETVLHHLSLPQIGVRLTAAKVLAREACKETNETRQQMIGNRVVTQALINRLEDAESKVVQNAICALAEISRRYFKDDLAYDPAIRLLKRKDPVTRCRAIDTAGYLREEQSFSDILTMVHDRSKAVRYAAFLSLTSTLMTIRLNGGTPISESSQSLVQSAAVVALADEETDIRNAASNALREIGNSQALPKLQNALQGELNPHTKAAISQAIEWIEKRSASI